MTTPNHSTDIAKAKAALAALDEHYAYFAATAKETETSGAARGAQPSRSAG